MNERVWQVVSAILVVGILGTWTWIGLTFTSSVNTLAEAKAKEIYSTTGDDIKAINLTLTTLNGSIENEIASRTEFRRETREDISGLRDDIKEIYNFLLDNDEEG